METFTDDSDSPSDPGVPTLRSSSESPLFIPRNSSSGIGTANLVEGTSHLVRKKRKISGTGHFKSSWSLPQFITSSTKGTKFAYCKLCYCHFSVSHGGINDIKRHVDCQKHKLKSNESDNSAKIAMFFREPQNQGLTHISRVISAEIMLSQFIALHNLSFQTSDHLSDLLASMFPDSKIASSLSCKHTKCKSIICDALDPHLKKPIVELSQSSPFNMLCDESNELGDSQKLLTILVRLFEPLNGVICTRHLDTVGITDLSAQGIYLAIKETLHKYHFPIENLLSFTSDTFNQ